MHHSTTCFYGGLTSLTPCYAKPSLPVVLQHLLWEVRVVPSHNRPRQSLSDAGEGEGHHISECIQCLARVMGRAKAPLVQGPRLWLLCLLGHAERPAHSHLQGIPRQDRHMPCPNPFSLLQELQVHLLKVQHGPVSPLPPPCVHTESSGTMPRSRVPSRYTSPVSLFDTAGGPVPIWTCARGSAPNFALQEIPSDNDKRQAPSRHSQGSPLME